MMVKMMKTKASIYLTFIISVSLLLSMSLCKDNSELKKKFSDKKDKQTETTANTVNKNEKAKTSKNVPPTTTTTTTTTTTLAKRTAKVITKYVNVPSVLVRSKKRIYNHSQVCYFDTYLDKKAKGEPLGLLIFLHGGDKGRPENLADVNFHSRRHDSIHAQRILQRLYDKGIIDDDFVVVAPRMYMGSGNFTNRGNENWGDFVAISLIQYMRLEFGCTGKVGSTGICEGGMSSMKLVMWYPYTFSYVGSMSGFFFKSFIEDEYFFNFKNLDKIYIGIGKQDPFVHNNRKFRDIVLRTNQNLFYDETDGTHPDFKLWRYELKQQIIYFFGNSTKYLENFKKSKVQ